MITDKQIALQEITKPNISFDEFDKSLLRDKDVALEYMKHHSSNYVLFRDFPIDIEQPGMIDNFNFVVSVINNLDIDYSKGNLKNMLKYSTSCIVKNKMKGTDKYNAEDLKCFAKNILLRYNDIVKSRDEELAQKQHVLDEVSQCIDDMLLDAFDTKSKDSKKHRYKRCNIGFTAEIK